MNKEFDKLHEQDRVDWFSQSTSFEFSVFVVWRTIVIDENFVRKSRVIVDIRSLNKISIKDSHSLSLQTDVIFAVKDCYFITVVDVASFFFQWRVNESDCHKFIVVSHWDQKYFNVAVQEYCNLSSYVQRQMNNILKEFRFFCRVYIDDVIIFSRILKDHCAHLHAVFFKFQTLRISLKLIKTFIDYLSVTLLRQKINDLELVIDEDKIRALKKLQFSATLSTLKKYLNLTDWLRSFIFYYA